MAQPVTTHARIADIFERELEHLDAASQKGPLSFDEVRKLVLLHKMFVGVEPQLPEDSSELDALTDEEVTAVLQAMRRKQRSEGQ